jgi:hypothetical protein
VRAYWTDRKNLEVADVDAKGGLVNPRAVAPIQSQRLVPVLVGSSAMTLAGDVEHPELTIVTGSSSG